MIALKLPDGKVCRTGPTCRLHGDMHKLQEQVYATYEARKKESEEAWKLPEKAQVYAAYDAEEQALEEVKKAGIPICPHCEQSPLLEEYREMCADCEQSQLEELDPDIAALDEDLYVKQRLQKERNAKDAAEDREYEEWKDRRSFGDY